MVLTVKGRVGLVEDGNTFGRPHNLMMSGACPPPAPSVWKAWMLRPLKAAIVSSTKPDSFSVSVWIATGDVELLGDGEAAIDRRRGGAPILVQFEAAGAGLDHLDQRLGLRRVALAEKAEIDRQALGRLQHAREVPRPRRAGRRRGAGRRPGAAAEHRRDAAVERLLDQLRADEMDMRVDAAGGDDPALAGDHLGARPDHDVDAGLDVGVAGLADAADAAVADADIGLDDAPMVEDDGVGDDGVDGALGAGACPCPMPSRITLPPPNLTSSP